MLISNPSDYGNDNPVCLGNVTRLRIVGPQTIYAPVDNLINKLQVINVECISDTGETVVAGEFVARCNSCRSQIDIVALSYDIHRNWKSFENNSRTQASQRLPAFTFSNGKENACICDVFTQT